MKRFLDKMNSIIGTVCAVLMMLLTLETIYVVIMRYVFNNTPHWGEIISRFLMVYACMFGFSLGIHDDTHIRITAFDRVLPRKILHVLDWFCILCMFIFSVFMVVEGVNYTILCDRNTISGLGLRSSWEMVCIPVGGLFCLLQTIRRAIMLKEAGR